MATMEEHPERHGWWINELESLGLSVKKINELNYLNEIRDLVEIIKQDKYIDYNTDYFNNGAVAQCGTILDVDLPFIISNGNYLESVQ
jgi:hypothetical protein